MRENLHVFVSSLHPAHCAHLALYLSDHIYVLASIDAFGLCCSHISVGCAKADRDRIKRCSVRLFDAHHTGFQTLF